MVTAPELAWDPTEDTMHSNVPASPPPAGVQRSYPSGSAVLTRTTLLTLGVVCLGLVVYWVGIGALEHSVAQSQLYSDFRKALAAGTVPTGQVDSKGHLITAGAPVALLKIPSIGINEVVVEGTSSETLTRAPGHLRSTPLPGQPGVSVIVGRQAAFGGPFRSIRSLRKGSVINVTVGFGSNTERFKVIDLRHPGSPDPPALQEGQSRLILVTGSGTPLVPGGLLYVDADLTTPVQPASSLVTRTVPNAERPGKGDTSTIWALVFWLEALLVAALAATWLWFTWGRLQTWMVFFPVVLLLGYFVSDQLTRMLPNVL